MNEILLATLADFAWYEDEAFRRFLEMYYGNLGYYGERLEKKINSVEEELKNYYINQF